MSNKILHYKKNLILIASFILIFISSYATTTVKGIVKDAVTKQPLPAVSVFIKGGKGVTTNADGSFALTTAGNNTTEIMVSHVGYQTAKLTITPGQQQVVEIELSVSQSPNNTVVVKTSKRGKYSNKDNPAVELVKK